MSSPERPSAMAAWWLACRPKTLLAAVVPVVVGVGAAWGDGVFRGGPALAALLGAVFIQIGTNFANDVFDFIQGADGEDRLGPTRAVAAGWLSPSQMKMGMVVAFGFAILLGVYLVWSAGWPVVVIGVASVLSGIFYTATRNSLAYLGFGDLFVMIFFGFVAVSGTYFVQASAWPESWFLLAFPVGAWATNIIVVNNLRDRLSDARADKRTLAVRFGRSFCLAEFALLGSGAYVAMAWLAWVEASPWLWLPLLSLPAAIVTTRAVFRAEGADLNPLLGATARVLALLGVTWSIGLALS
ncbi:MAG: 1,4-dihydroxy-2-naphthoate polyprenyltransferase [Myxococcota bacterium]